MLIRIESLTVSSHLSAAPLSPIIKIAIGVQSGIRPRSGGNTSRA